MENRLIDAVKSMIELDASGYDSGNDKTRAALEIVKAWIAQYQDNDCIDEVVANLLASVICEATRTIASDMKKSEDNGEDTYYGSKAMAASVIALKRIASDIENQLMISVNSDEEIKH